MSDFWIEPYRAYFQKRFRKPFDVQVFHDTDGFALKLAVHDQAAPGFGAYASLGLADKLAANEEDDFGEVFLLADVPDKIVPQLFVNALFFVLHNDIPLGSRFAIGGIDQVRPTFAASYDKSALYFTFEKEDDDTFHHVRNGEEFGRVYQAVFIASDEHLFLEEYGADAFDKKLWAQLKKDRRIGRPSCLLENDSDDKLDTHITEAQTGIRAMDPRDNRPT